MSLRMTKISSAAAIFLAAIPAFSSDTRNLCSNAPGAPSANVSLPKDDTFHYVTAPQNLQTGSNGFESDFKAWHWIVNYNGSLQNFDGYRFMFAIYTGPQGGWIKYSIFNLVGPDGQHQFARLEPGQFNAPTDSYDLRIGTNWIATGSGGSEDESFVSDDGLYAVNLHDEAVKNPTYPFNDGYANYISPTTGQSLGASYYWARPAMSSYGTMTYNGQAFQVFGTAWQDRQWLGQNNTTWNWAAIQLDSGETYAAYDIREKSSGLPTVHSLTIEGAPKSCAREQLSSVDDWTLQASGSWVSPASGASFQTDFRLLVPSKNVDLHIVPTRMDQEVVAAIGLFPGGAWEGAATVEGTINGRQVHGRAYVEQFNK